MAKPALNIAEDGDGGCLKVIIEKARKSGYVNFQELLDCLSSKGITEQEQIEDIATMIEDMGFDIAR